MIWTGMGMFFFHRPLRSRFIRWNDAESVPYIEDSTGRQGHQEDPLSNRGGRFVKPLNPSGIYHLQLSNVIHQGFGTKTKF